MKRCALLLFFTISTVLLVSSCMGDSNEQMFLISQPGVAVAEDKTMKIQLKNYNFVYSENLSGINDGDCLLFDYSIDYGLMENADSARTYSTYKVEITNRYELPQYQLVGELDTTQASMFNNERMISSLQERTAYIRDRLFLFAIHRVDSFQLENNYEIQYNAKQEPQVEDGRRIYNVYLRVHKDRYAEEQKTTNPDNLYINAFNFTPIADKERKAGQDSLRLKIHYVASFNKDTTAIGSWNIAEYNFLLDK